MDSPRHPCSHCGCDRFMHIAKVNIEWYVAGRRSGSDEFHGDVLVCTGCGRTEMFVREPQKLYEALDQAGRRPQIVAPPAPPPPYRG